MTLFLVPANKINIERTILGKVSFEEAKQVLDVSIINSIKNNLPDSNGF